jgi:serine/threonine protein kinase
LREIIKIKDSNYFFKSFPIESLISDLDRINRRLQSIKEVTEYSFDYHWTPNNLVLRSQLIHGKHIKLNENQLSQLAIYLDYIHSKGIYHGDVRVNNILISNEKPFLIDWEPCIIQLIKSKRIVKSYSGGIANKDRLMKEISFLTDRKGFLRLISNQIFNELADTPVMEKLTCTKLLNYQLSSVSSS